MTTEFNSKLRSHTIFGMSAHASSQIRNRKTTVGRFDRGKYSRDLQPDGQPRTLHKQFYEDPTTFLRAHILMEQGD
jgi:hypothetical protein